MWIWKLLNVCQTCLWGYGRVYIDRYTWMLVKTASTLKHNIEMLDREICSVKKDQPAQAALLEVLENEKSAAENYLKYVLQDGEIRGADFSSCMIDRY